MGATSRGQELQKAIILLEDELKLPFGKYEVVEFRFAFCKGNLQVYDHVMKSRVLEAAIAFW